MRKIRLAQYHVGRLIVLRRPRIPDQHAVVLRIRHVQSVVRNPHALWSAHSCCRNNAKLLCLQGIEIWLTYHQIGMRVAVRYRVPKQNTIVIGVCDRETDSIAGNGCGVIQPGVLSWVEPARSCVPFTPL